MSRPAGVATVALLQSDVDVVEMSPEEKFLFDLQGYIRVPNALSGGEVAELNAAIDANRDRITVDGNSETSGSAALAGPELRLRMDGMLEWPAPWSDPFRRLIAHRSLLPYCNTLLGPGWRMDHEPRISLAGNGAGGLVLHGSGRHWFGPAYYTCHHGRMFSGMIVVEWVLSPVGEDDGGFCLIPGSHKVNLPCPSGILRCEEHTEVVRTVPAQPGDMILFTEALHHGTLPWRGEHERRTLFYRYSPAFMHWHGDYWRATPPPWVAELDEAERAVLEGPYFYNRPVIEDDGRVTTRIAW